MRLLISAFMAVALLGACQSSSQQPALVGCSAYASALESLAVRRQAGLLSDEVIAEVDSLRSVATPICTAETPPADAQLALDGVLLQLEAILAREISQGDN